MTKHFIISLLVVVSVVMTSCYNEPDCEQVVSFDYVNLGFYDIETKKEDKRKFLSIRAIGSDSVFYPDEIKDSLQVFSLRLNPLEDTVAFLFRTAVTRDTLILHYKRNLEWISEECGPILRYSDLEMVYYTFDSVVQMKNSFGIKVEEHIEIYN